MSHSWGSTPDPRPALSPLLSSSRRRQARVLSLSARPRIRCLTGSTHLITCRLDCQVGAMGEKDKVHEKLRGYARGVRSGLALEGKQPLPVRTLWLR